MNKSVASIGALALLISLTLTGCSGQSKPETSPSTSNEVEVDVPDSEIPVEDSFVDGVLTTSDLTITITDYKVIPVGGVGNEYGEVPVLAIWYETKNLGTSDREITPSSFIGEFEAFQDNNPDFENKLDVGSHPDDSLVDTQLVSIKAGRTLANATSFELSDTITPVELVAGIFGDEIGRMTFNLK